MRFINRARTLRVQPTPLGSSLLQIVESEKRSFGAPPGPTPRRGFCFEWTARDCEARNKAVGAKLVSKTGGASSVPGPLPSPPEPSAGFFEWNREYRLDFRCLVVQCGRLDQLQRRFRRANPPFRPAS